MRVFVELAYVWLSRLPRNTWTALKISRIEMIRVMHDEPAFADVFLNFLLARSMGITEGH